jgi:hypothetical protein
MKDPIGSVATEVPDGWEAARSDTEVQFQDFKDTTKVNLFVWALNGPGAPEAYLQSQIAQFKATFTDYHEVRATGRLTDKTNPYAEWEYTYARSAETYHAILRVYGAKQNHPDKPTAWAAVEFTAPEKQYDTQKAIFQHAVDHITWDE